MGLLLVPFVLGGVGWAPAMAAASENPVAVADNYTVNVDDSTITNVTENVLANDTDPLGAQLYAEWNGPDGPQAGSQPITNGVGWILWDSGELDIQVASDAPSQTVQIQYVAMTDDNRISTPVFATITIKAQPAAPVARNDVYNHIYANVVNFNPLANDTDPQGLPLSIVRYTQPTLTYRHFKPSVALIHGAFRVSNVPVGAAFSLSWQYTVSSGYKQATATVTATYSPIKDPHFKVLKHSKKANKKKHRKAKTGKLRVTNPNPLPVLMTYWNDDAHHPKQFNIHIAAHGSRVIERKWADVGYIAYLLTPQPLRYADNSNASVILG